MKHVYEQAQHGHTWSSPLQQAQNGFVETSMIRTLWHFPQHPPTQWTKSQEQAYQQAQRVQLPESPL
jgi:hypothetical protein